MKSVRPQPYIAMLAEDSASQILKEKISIALDTMRQINVLQEEITLHLAHEARKAPWHNFGEGVQKWSIQFRPSSSWPWLIL